MEQRDGFTSNSANRPTRIELPRRQELEHLDSWPFDSSITTGCAAVYLVVTPDTGKIVKQLAAKARVAKPGFSVPRLELDGAQMLTRMFKNIKAVIRTVHVRKNGKTVLFGWQIAAGGSSCSQQE